MSLYWTSFANFEPNAEASLIQDFNRLAVSQGWSKDERRKQRAECYNAEYAHYFHDDDWSPEGKLAIWQRLCEIVGLVPGKSITKCRKVSECVLESRGVRRGIGWGSFAGVLSDRPVMVDFSVELQR